MARHKDRQGAATRRRRRSQEQVARKQPRRRRWLLGLVAAAVVGGGVVGYHLVRSCVGRSLRAAIELPHGAGAGFNIVLITLDTLRSDHVGCYGAMGVKTTALDALAAGGVRVTDAVTPVPMTLPAHASILTGEYPPRHGVRDNGTYRLAEDRETLAERLRAEGYATAAFISAFVLDRRYGLAQGFDVYDDQFTPPHGSSGGERLNPQRPGNVVTDAAIRWLEEHQRARPDQRFFAWIHLFDPHTPYSPPEPFKTQYASTPYDGEVAFTDQEVGRLVDTLGALDLLNRTILVAVGDHGEGLGDHGESTHSLLIYGSTMRVPLIFYGPGLLPPGRVVDDRVVSTVDIEPTLLDLLALDPRGGDGESLLRAPADPDRAVYLETLAPRLNHGWSALYGLRTHRHKYIAAPTPEYYDLRTDATEERNLWPERSGEVDALAKRLAELVESFPASESAEAATAALDQEAIEKLASLGYVRGGVVPDTGSLADPKDMVFRLDRQLARATALIAVGRHREAIPLIRQLLAIAPGDASLWSLLSVAQVQASLLDEALASRTKSVELQPNDSRSWLILGELQYAKGDLNAWRVSLAQAERLEPESGDVFLARAKHARRSGRNDEAVAQCREARDRDPTRCAARSWVLEGEIYHETGNLAEAEQAYAGALEVDPLAPAALFGLARCAERLGQLERVVQLCGRISRGRSEWPLSRTTLANAHIQLGQGDEAVRVMTEWLQVSPGLPGVHNNLGSVFLQLGRLSEAAACYQKALELDPTFPEAQRNLSRLRKIEAESNREARDPS